MGGRLCEPDQNEFLLHSFISSLYRILLLKYLVPDLVFVISELVPGNFFTQNGWMEISLHNIGLC